MRKVKENPKSGDIVLFGRPNGQLTKGKIVRVNQKSITLIQQEERGTQRSYTTGTQWRVGRQFVYELDYDLEVSGG